LRFDDYRAPSEAVPIEVAVGHSRHTLYNNRFLHLLVYGPDSEVVNFDKWSSSELPFFHSANLPKLHSERPQPPLGLASFLSKRPVIRVTTDSRSSEIKDRDH
jgi:hypothetical protein